MDFLLYAVLFYILGGSLAVIAFVTGIWYNRLYNLILGVAIGITTWGAATYLFIRFVVWLVKG